MPLLIVGSVAFDSIETPFGKVNNALGGSATYFSLAASFFDRPSLVAVVGEDFNASHRSILQKKKIDISGLEKAKGRSFHWGGKYSFDLNNRETLFTELNVFENFDPKLGEKHKHADNLFLGNIHPALQMKVLKQIKKPKLVGLDTMNFWIEKTPSELAEVLRQTDVFIINDSECRELTGQHNLIKAARVVLDKMGKKKRTPPTLIVKRGEYGLLMFQKHEIFHLPGFPLEDVVDPTGAGDSFAGGFMGYLSKTSDLGWDNLKRACVAGSVIASFCVEKLGTKRLQDVSTADINRRFKDFKKLTNF